MTELEKIKRVIQYKGFTITFRNKHYHASAYANPSFHNTNLKGLKKQINTYLKS